MKSIRLITALSPIMLMACTGATSFVTLKNTLPATLHDELITINRTRLNAPAHSLYPIFLTSDGDTLLSQIEDLNRDGVWDAVTFMCDLKPNESTRMKISWIPAADYPTFAPRTNIRYGKMIEPGIVKELLSDCHDSHNLPRGEYLYPYQMDGPAWENDKVAFRHYFDGRNCCDVFGKRIPEMVLDTIGITSEGHPHNTYQTMQSWGVDILSVANSFGLGGLALLTTDGIVRLGVTSDRTEDNIDSTRYELIAEGPLSSTFRLTYHGWHTGFGDIDLSEEITIRAGIHGFEKTLHVSQLPDNTSLITGIVANRCSKPFIEKVYDGAKAFITHDNQTVNCDTNLGMAILLPEEFHGGSFHAPDSAGDIRNTWCMRLHPDSNGHCRFKVYAGWELSDSTFASSDAFVKYISDEVSRYTYPPTITISSQK